MERQAIWCHVLFLAIVWGSGLEATNESSIFIMQTPQSALLLARSTHSPGKWTNYPGKPPSGEVQCDKYCCNCVKDWAYCSGGQLRKTVNYLPRVPANVRHFRMWWAYYPNLTRTMMANLSNFNIVTIDLAENKIARLAPDAFTDFVNLTKLILSKNVIAATDLQAAFVSLSNSPLNALALDGMGLRSVPQNFFQAFTNRTFQSINLQNNSFSSYNNSVFSPFWRVDIVNMSDNVLTRMNLDVRVNIKKLILVSNRLQIMPDFCLQAPKTGGDQHHVGDQDVSAFYYLQSLELAQNIFEGIPRNFFRRVCLPDLVKLDVSGASKLELLENNFIADLPKLQVLMINEVKLIRGFEPFAFNSSSLRRLTLDHHYRKIDKSSVDLDNMFRHCPNLTELYIRGTKIDLKENEDLVRLLRPLTSIEIIGLLHTTLGFLPEDTLWRLPKLKTLIFAENHLNSYNMARALKNVTSIEVLNLETNRITVVNETTLPPELRRNLREINLSLNLFSCSCELLWFRTWLDDVIRNKSVIVRSYPAHYKCNTPDNMKGRLLSEYHPTQELCAVKSPYVLIAIVAGCTLIVLVISGALTYRYRWHLRFYVYRMTRRKRYIQIQGNGDNEEGETTPLFKYDAYVAHSSKDLDWIMEELVPLLEGDHGLKVFIDERDAHGGTIGDNIAKYMDDSARIMLVLSDNYNREGWRQYEFEHILFSAIENNKDVIVLLLGNVEAGRMTKDMRRMLTRGSYLQWGRSEDARKLFREGLRVAIRTESSDQQNLC